MKVVLSLTVTLALLVPSGTLALAQGVEDYVHEDGFLFFEGDMVFTCDDLPRLIGDPELPSARGALQACAGLGSPPSPEDGALRDTGGVPLTGPIFALALAGGLVLTGRRFRPLG